MPVELSDILKIVEKQNQWRGRETLNMIASENTQSPAVRQIECSDFMGRYAEGHPNTELSTNRYYEGTAYIDQLESMATREMMDLAQCTHADVTAHQRESGQYGRRPGHSAGRGYGHCQFDRYRRSHQP